MGFYGNSWGCGSFGFIGTLQGCMGIFGRWRSFWFFKHPLLCCTRSPEGRPLVLWAPFKKSLHCMLWIDCPVMEWSWEVIPKGGHTADSSPTILHHIPNTTYSSQTRELYYKTFHHPFRNRSKTKKDFFHECLPLDDTLEFVKTLPSLVIMIASFWLDCLLTSTLKWIMDICMCTIYQRAELQQ